MLTEPEVLPPDEPAAPRQRILVVEDSRTQAERLAHVLRQERYQVEIAEDGHLAREAAALRPPDLVISDVNMPGMDGYELCRQLKSDPVLHEVPVILVTSMSDPQDVIRGLECGADNFLLKPYDERYMLGRVRYVLANSQVRSAEDAAMGVTVFFHGNRHLITADRLQILNLLLSTYEAAIERNRELTQSQETLEERSAEIGMAHRFLDQVIECIPSAVFVKNASDLRYIRVNRALEELFGVTREAVVGRSDHELVPELAEMSVSQDREVLAGAGTHTSELVLHIQGKGERILRTRKVAIVDGFEEPRFVLGITEDVTEARAREREILRLNTELAQRTAEADAANRAKSTFLATMSHEIRTPMNGMLGMLELLALTNLNDDQRALLGTIRDSSASLLRIVDDVLDFSKIEAGQLEVHPEACSIAQVVRDVQRTFAAAAAGKGLVLRTLADPGIAPSLWVDSVRLRQILGNFVSNAIKFTPSGSVEILVELAAQGRGEQTLRFQVRDTGIGISEENQRKLFQPFSQGDAESARRAGGTGLGLSICRRLADLMGGSITMSSELGRGTTLSLELPLRVADGLAPTPVGTEASVAVEPVKARRKPPDIQAAEAQRRLVLVVDDHPTNRALLLRQVNTLGYAAEAAEDGEQALEMWRSGRFALVITDCEMPGLTGYELAAEIRGIEAESGLPRTPILACTAHALAGETEKCIAAGMDDCLVKPIDLQGLAKRLEQWLPLEPAASDGTDGKGDARPPLDREMIAQTWGDDPASLVEVLEFFQRANNEDAAKLKKAIGERDVVLAARASHRMLGASKVIGANDYAAACAEVNQAARAADWDRVADAMPRLDAEWARLAAYMGTLTGATHLPHGAAGED